MAHGIDRIEGIILGLLLLLLPHSTQAHNGAVTIAVPIEGITVDGDLSDWPEGMREYPLLYPAQGDSLKGEEDFQGNIFCIYRYSQYNIY